MNILITGGAGYKGCLLAKALLEENHQVTILDNFMYGAAPVIHLLNHPASYRLSVIEKDIRNIKAMDVAPYDTIYHLAGISGYPACENNPHSAHMINVVATEQLVKLLDADQKLINASTTSFYGKSGEVRTEDSTPDPISIYGKTKWQAEEICMQHPNALSFRFATIFGIAPKMRCELMLNDFVYRAITDRALVIYDGASNRPFLHVADAIRAYVHWPHLSGIYNVGDSTMNFSKKGLAEKIKETIPFEIIDATIEDKDKRDYVIDFSKIEAEGFKATVSIDEGIQELKKLYSFYKPFVPYAKI